MSYGWAEMSGFCLILICLQSRLTEKVQNYKIKRDEVMS